jgi:hypothetical protein
VVEIVGLGGGERIAEAGLPGVHRRLAGPGEPRSPDLDAGIRGCRPRQLIVALIAKA